MTTQIPDQLTAPPQELDPGQVFVRGVEISLGKVRGEIQQLELRGETVRARLATLGREARALTSALTAYQRIAGKTPSPAPATKRAQRQANDAAGPTIRDQIRAAASADTGVVLISPLCEDLTALGLYPKVQLAMASVESVARVMVKRGELKKLAKHQYRLVEQGA